MTDKVITIGGGSSNIDGSIGGSGIRDLPIGPLQPRTSED